MSDRAIETHEVLNQPPPLADFDIFGTDRALVEAVQREGAGWAMARLAAFGQQMGRSETLELGVLANRYPPVLLTHDRYGKRRDEVEFHPAWHSLMRLAVTEGLHAAPWSEPRPGAHVARAAAFIVQGQVENGVQCPITMTFGSVPTLRRQIGIASAWLPKIQSRDYDPHFLPVTEKTGALIGMGMTEKQGGSDVRANTSRAEPASDGGTGAEYLITGHKWFFSAPMCDAFLILAQAPAGLSCFFLPRWTPDGRLNAIRIQRLKDKVGNRSNASSEVEFHQAHAWLVGEAGRGVQTILEMGTYTRLDCALGTTGLMRLAVSQALHHASYRTAFQKHLIDQPLMSNVLADLALEAEAATALTLRLARAFDHADDESETLFRRLMTPAAKFWICKRGAMLGAEAMEVLGGNGYVEEGPMGRMYREMPVNSIWEGSGNIMCLDVLRALGRSPRTLEVLHLELKAARTGNARLDRFATALFDQFGDPANAESSARRLTEQLVLAVQASLLVRFAPPEVSDAFCASRLDHDWGGSFGTLPRGSATQAITERARPAILPVQ